MLPRVGILRRSHCQSRNRGSRDSGEPPLYRDKALPPSRRCCQHQHVAIDSGELKLTRKFPPTPKANARIQLPSWMPWFSGGPPRRSYWANIGPFNKADLKTPLHRDDHRGDLDACSPSASVALVLTPARLHFLLRMTCSSMMKPSQDPNSSWPI